MCELESLVAYAQDAMYAETEYRIGSKKLPTHYIPSLDGSVAYRVGKQDARSEERWNALSAMCRLLDVSHDNVMSLTRSIRRYEEHGGKYDRIFSYEPGVTRRMRRYLSPVPFEKTHYAATNRPIR